MSFQKAVLFYCWSLVLVFLLSLSSPQDIYINHHTAPQVRARVGRLGASDREARLEMNGRRLCTSISVVQAKGNRENCHVLSCWTSLSRWHLDQVCMYNHPPQIITMWNNTPTPPLNLAASTYSLHLTHKSWPWIWIESPRCRLKGWLDLFNFSLYL